MKKTNALLLGLLCVSAVAGLSSCGEEPLYASDEERVAAVKASLVFPNLTTGIKIGFEVYNKIDDVAISYESENKDLLYFNEENTMCYVNAPELDPENANQIKLTSFTATFTYNDLVDKKTFKVKILPTGHAITVGELVTYADTNNAAPTEYSAYAIKGVLVATTEKAALFYDGTGYIYSYKVCSYDIGSYVYVDGALSIYNGIIEFGSDASYGAIYEPIPFEVPEFNPIELKSELKISTWLGNPSMAVYTGSMIKLTGTPVVSGNYINLEIDNVTTKVGSLVYPTSEFSAIIDKAVKEKKKVAVEGYSLYLSGSDKYINMIVTGVTII